MERTPVVSSESFERASLPYRSLSERLHELNESLWNWGGTDVQAVYARLFRECFALHPWHGQARTRSRDPHLLDQVESWCVARGVDVATFIAGNMILMRERLHRARHRFQVRMLLSDAAERRYNGFLSRLVNRYRQGSYRPLWLQETWIGKLRTAAIASEYDVGFFYLRGNLRGEVTLDEAIAASDVSDAWWDLHARRGMWLRIRSLFGEPRADAEHRVMVLEGVSQVLNGLRVGLADEIGYHELTWAALLRLVKRLFPVPPARREFDLRGVDVKVWRPLGGY